MKTTTNKIFIVTNDFDNSEIEESTMTDYIERYGKEGHKMTFACSIKIVKKTNSKSKVKLISYDEAYGKDFEDMPRRVPDTSKLRNLIGFAPENNLDKILDEVIEYAKKHAR